MGSFHPKLNKYELKSHREVIYHDNEKWRKILKGTDWSFQSWYKELDEFWPEHLKVSKHFHFNELLLSKVYIVWVKKIQRGYLLRNLIGIQNLERNLLVVSELA